MKSLFNNKLCEQEGRNYNAVRLRIEQEEKLARELNRLKREEIKEIKMRQQLRETSVELRELEAKLRCAYVTKELSAQLAEKEYLKMKQKVIYLYSLFVYL